MFRVSLLSSPLIAFTSLSVLAAHGTGVSLPFIVPDKGGLLHVGQHLVFVDPLVRLAVVRRVAMTQPTAHRCSCPLTRRLAHLADSGSINQCTHARASLRACLHCTPFSYLKQEINKSMRVRVSLLALCPHFSSLTKKVDKC